MPITSTAHWQGPFLSRADCWLRNLLASTSLVTDATWRMRRYIDYSVGSCPYPYFHWQISTYVLYTGSYCSATSKYLFVFFFSFFNKQLDAYEKCTCMYCSVHANLGYGKNIRRLAQLSHTRDCKTYVSIEISLS